MSRLQASTSKVQTRNDDDNDMLQRSIRALPIVYEL